MDKSYVEQKIEKYIAIAVFKGYQFIIVLHDWSPGWDDYTCEYMKTKEDLDRSLPHYVGPDGEQICSKMQCLGVVDMSKVDNPPPENPVHKVGDRIYTHEYVKDVVMQTKFGTVSKVYSKYHSIIVDRMYDYPEMYAVIYDDGTKEKGCFNHKFHKLELQRETSMAEIEQALELFHRVVYAGVGAYLPGTDEGVKRELSFSNRLHVIIQALGGRYINPLVKSGDIEMLKLGFLSDILKWTKMIPNIREKGLLCAI